MNGGALEPSVLDALRELNQPGEPDVVAEVLGLFRAGSAPRLAAVRAALEQRDAAALQRAAHDLKGASGTIGAYRLQRCCRHLEDAARAGRLEDAAALADALHHEHGRVAAEIDLLLRQ